jgi:MFS family permease
MSDQADTPLDPNTPRALSTAALAATAWRRDPMVHAVLALGLTQITSWGTTLYALGVLGRPIATDTGWSQGLVFGGLTAGLLAASVVSAPIGRLIDRHGARVIMTVGSVLAAATLALAATVTTPLAWLAAWVALGIAMRMVLYDAAFAAIVQVAPARGRRAISYLTLFGGFASSVFWPIGHWLNQGHGWRATLLIFALINLLVCAPLHWLALRPAAAADPIAAPATPAPAATGEAPIGAEHRGMAMLVFGAILSITGFVFGALAAHLVPVLEWTGIGATTAVWLASLKGFAQVAGRTWELLFAKSMPALKLGTVSIALLPISFGVLLLAGSSLATAFAFTMLFGVANGLLTIVRGAVPLVLFGAQGYGAVLGTLAAPYLVMNAVAPMAFAITIERLGMITAITTLLCASLAALAGILAMARWHRSLQTVPPESAR